MDAAGLLLIIKALVDLVNQRTALSDQVNLLTQQVTALSSERETS